MDFNRTTAGGRPPELEPAYIAALKLFGPEKAAVLTQFIPTDDNQPITSRSSLNACKHYLSNDGPALERRFPARVQTRYNELAADLKPIDHVERGFVRGMARASVRNDLLDDSLDSYFVTDKAIFMAGCVLDRENQARRLFDRIDEDQSVPTQFLDLFAQSTYGAHLLAHRMQFVKWTVLDGQPFDPIMYQRILNTYNLGDSHRRAEVYKSYPLLEELFDHRRRTANPTKSHVSAISAQLIQMMDDCYNKLVASIPALDLAENDQLQMFMDSMDLLRDPRKSSLHLRYYKEIDRIYLKNLSELYRYRDRKEREASEARAARVVDSEQKAARNLQKKADRAMARAGKRRGKAKPLNELKAAMPVDETRLERLEGQMGTALNATQPSSSRATKSEKSKKKGQGQVARPASEAWVTAAPAAPESESSEFVSEALEGSNPENAPGESTQTSGSGVVGASNERPIEAPKHSASPTGQVAPTSASPPTEPPRLIAS